MHRQHDSVAANETHHMKITPDCTGAIVHTQLSNKDCALHGSCPFHPDAAHTKKHNNMKLLFQVIAICVPSRNCLVVLFGLPGCTRKRAAILKLIKMNAIHNHVQGMINIMASTYPPWHSQSSWTFSAIDFNITDQQSLQYACSIATWR